MQIPDYLPDIVININPNNPPYSLVILQKLIQDVVVLKVTTHLHSTVSTLPDNAKDLENKLLSFKPKFNMPNIHLRLIWKNGKCHRKYLMCLTNSQLDLCR